MISGELPGELPEQSFLLRLALQVVVPALVQVAVLALVPVVPHQVAVQVGLLVVPVQQVLPVAPKVPPVVPQVALRVVPQAALRSALRDVFPWPCSVIPGSWSPVRLYRQAVGSLPGQRPPLQAPGP